MDAVLRSDGAFTVVVDVAGDVTFNSAAGAGPAGLHGTGVTVVSRAELRLGKTTFCHDCGLELLSADVRETVDVKQDAFKLHGRFLFAYPCERGDAVTGAATMDIRAGEMAVALGVTVKYLCGNPNAGSPTMTFAFLAQPGATTHITNSVALKELTVRAAVYPGERGAWDVSGEMQGIVVVDGDAASAAAAATLGWHPTRARTWRHVLDVERRAKPRLGLAAHRALFPGANSPAYSQAHLGKSEHHMPAHLGFTLTTNFSFDTRPDPPLFTASVVLDDIVLGCLVVSLKASGTTCESAAESSVGVAVTGTLNFDNCDGLTGSGAVSGKIWCDDGGDHPLYAFVAESNSLQLGEVIVKDVIMSAVASSATGGVEWAFVIAGKLEYSESSGFKTPSLGVAASLAIRARASISPVGGFLFEDVLVSGGIAYATNEIAVKGTFVTEYPCQPGGFTDVNLSFAMSMASVAVDGLEARAKLYCEPPVDFPLLSVDLAIDYIEVKGFKIINVAMHVDMYSVKTVAGTAGADESDVSRELTFQGSMSGALAVPLEGMEAGASVALSFDTESKSFHVTVALQISAPPVTLDLQVGLSGGTGCDAVNGDFLHGGITIDISEDRKLAGSVRGAKHCESHPQMMHALGEAPPRISPKYDVIAYFLNSTREQSWLQTQLEGAFPMFNIHGTVDAAQLAPGVFLHSATMAVYNYNVNGTQYWAFEVTGSVSFEAESGAANPALQPRPAGLAAVLYVAVAGYSSHAGLVDYSVGVTASVDATFGGGAVSVNLKGTLAFTFPCTNIMGHFLISISDLGAGVDAQKSIAVSATLGCQGDATPHAPVMAVKGSLAGLIANDIVVIDRLDIEASLHNSADSDGLYLVATITGEVTPVTVVPGLKVSAQLVANTSAPMFVLEVGLLYHSTVLDAELNGTVHLPLANCRAGDTLSLRGKISVHLGGGGGDINAAAEGSKFCDRNASNIYGFTYAVSFALDKTNIKLGGGLTLSVKELAAKLYGKVIGSASAGGDGKMSWFGSLNATVGISSFSGSGMVPRSLSEGSDIDAQLSVALAMKSDAVALTLAVDFAYKSDAVSFQGEGTISLAAVGDGAALQPTGVSAKGTFGLKMGSDINVSLAASFELKIQADADDGRDMSVFLSSGVETISIGGVDLGTFTISASRFVSVPTSGSTEGWRGVLTSSNPLLDTMVVFDTRDGSIEVKATLKLDMGPVILELSAAASCEAAGTVTVGAAVVLKAHPAARLTGDYVKFCDTTTQSSELDWSLTARVQTWKFATGISLTDVGASFRMRKQGGLLINIQAVVDFTEGTAAPMALGGLAAHITIDGDDIMSLRVNGDVAIDIDAVTLTGHVSFTFPCYPGTSNFVELGMAIDSDAVKLDHVVVHGEWMCQGDSPAMVAADKAAAGKAVVEAAAAAKPVSSKLSSYNASIALMQVGSFALVDVEFEMYNLNVAPDMYRGTFQGTFAISPELSITAVVPFGEEQVTYEVTVDTQLKIGDVDVQQHGHGTMKSECVHMGDLSITVDVNLSNIPVTWMRTIDGRGTFSSNCGDEYQLLVDIELDDAPILLVGDAVSATPPADAKLSFGVHSVNGEASFSVSYTIALDPRDARAGTIMVFADILPNGNFNLGVKFDNVEFGGLLSAIGDAFPGSGVGGSNPVAGSAASAQLAATGAIGAALGQGHNLDSGQVASLGGFGDVINAIKIKRVLAMFSLLPDNSVALTVSLYGMQLFGLSLEAFVHLIKDNESGKWKALVYLGFLDIKDGYLDFPKPFTFLSHAINVGVFVMGGGLVKLGFTYASDDIIVHPHIRQYSPVDIHFIKGGFNLQLAQDLSKDSGGIAGAFLGFQKSIAGRAGRMSPATSSTRILNSRLMIWTASYDVASNVCKALIVGDCAVWASALQQLVCDDMANTNDKEWPTVLPVDGTAKFGHSFVSKDGVRLTRPTDDTQIWWMRLTVEVEVKFGAIALMVEVVARVLFDRDVISENKVMMKVEVGVTSMALEAAFGAKLTGDSQIWANPFGKLPHMGIIFPLSLALGIRIVYVGAVTPYKFDIEAGILGCGSPVLYKAGLHPRDYDVVMPH